MQLLFTLLDYPDYAIDKDGNVWRITASSSRRWRNRPLPFKVATFFMKKSSKDVGVDLTNAQGERKRVRVAHLVCSEFHGPRLGRRVAFNDGDSTNLSATNLRWVGRCKVKGLTTKDLFTGTYPIALKEQHNHV